MNSISYQNIHHSRIFTKSDIEKKLIKIEGKIDKLEQKMDTILELLSENKTDCEKMSSHIDFINTVYSNVKAPLDYVCNTINGNMINDK